MGGAGLLALTLISTPALPIPLRAGAHSVLARVVDDRKVDEQVEGYGGKKRQVKTEKKLFGVREAKCAE